jgi:hypothetical protein
MEHDADELQPLHQREILMQLRSKRLSATPLISQNVLPTPLLPI